MLKNLFRHYKLLKQIRKTNLFSSIPKRIAAEPLPFLQLEPSRSYLKPGESIEVDCSSSAGPYVKVTWQRNNGGALPNNFRV